MLAGARALQRRSVRPSRTRQFGQRGWSSQEREGPAARDLSGSASRRAAMILEERPDDPGAGEDSARLQDDSSIRKVGAEKGCGFPAFCPVLCGAAFAAFPSWDLLP